MANRSYKGRRFEIELAALLSRWWTRGQRDDVFWHTHDSGGRSTRRAAKGKSTCGLHGDICAVDPIGAPLLRFATIEAKKGYNRATIGDLLDKPNGAAKQTYEAWWDQAAASCKAAGSLGWLLIHQRDRRQAIVVMSWYLHTCLVTAHARLQPVHCENPVLRFDLGVGKGIAAMWLEDFLIGVRPHHIQTVLRRMGDDCHEEEAGSEG